MSAALIIAVVSAAGAVASALIAHRSRVAAEDARRSNEAQTRLEVETGPLQLELFLETRSFARRLVHYVNEGLDGDGHGLACYRDRDNDNAGAYHRGGLMIYRILRPFTVGEIIEKQTMEGDLLLDPKMLELLRFSQGAVEMLTGQAIGEALDGDGRMPGFEMERCWDVGDEGGPAYQRVRGSYLRCGAAALLAPESPGERGRRRCIGHAEFCKLWERPGKDSERSRDFHDALEPLKRVIHNFSPEENPVFWLRLVAYAYTCESFYDRAWDRAWERLGRRRVLRWAWGRAMESIGRPGLVEYKRIELDVPELLGKVGDKGDANAYISAHAGRYPRRFEQIIESAL